MTSPFLRRCPSAATSHAARLRWWIWLAAAALLLGLAPSAAHDVPGELRIHAFVRPEGEQLRVLVRVPLDLLLNINLPKRGNGYLELSQVERAFPRAIAALARDLEFLEDGKPLKPVHGQARISLPSDKSFQSYAQALASLRGPPLPPTTDVFWNQGYFDALLEYPIRSKQSSFEVDFRISRGLADRLKLDLRYVMHDGEVRAFEFATGSGHVALDPRWYQAASTFVIAGVQHILGGWDHLLFLLCLVVPFRRFGWPLVGVVTAFTVAHSITLIAAAHGWVPRGDWFPPLVELLIAVSILYMAVDNVLRPNLRWRWLVTALFGLVHGVGFSFSLANELQFAGSHLLLSLLAFNVGIELGQLLVLAAIWPPLAWLLYRAGVSERVGVVIVTAFAAHSAWHWTVERWAALMKTELPDISAATLMRAGLAALAVAALLWLPRMLAQRRGAAARASAIGRATVELPPDARA